MMEITALNNNLVKETVKLQQKKYRTESGKFLLEGYKPISEAVGKIKLEYVFVLSEKLEKYKFLDCEIIKTNSAVLKKISTTESFPEAVGVGYQPDNNIEKLLKSKKVILLENISDAGNLGTIIRSASAFNIDSIILFGNTVDLYNPKCVRSAVGNLWKINIVHIEKIDLLKKIFADFERVATLPKSSDSIWFKDWTPKEKCLVLFGSEADGLSEELVKFANKNITIEMGNRVESLNLGISAGIVMYKLGI